MKNEKRCSNSRRSGFASRIGFLPRLRREDLAKRRAPRWILEQQGPI
jgi:hypothetical protein